MNEWIHSFINTNKNLGNKDSPHHTELVDKSTVTRDGSEGGRRCLLAEGARGTLTRGALEPLMI